MVLRFESINAAEYFNAHQAQAEWWVKTVDILARVARPGETIITKLGDLEETCNTAKARDMVVMNPFGECYLVSEAKFVGKYELVNNRPEVSGYSRYRSIGKPARCLLLNRNVEFLASWNEPMRIEAGGFLVCQDNNDYYGVQSKAFNETYRKLPRLPPSQMEASR